jgi:hypothetical protein
MTSAGGLVDIGPSAARFIGFADSRGLSPGGAGSRWFVLGLAARGAPFPFGPIPLILACLRRTLYCAAQIQK